jgi:hypothetical protein
MFIGANITFPAALPCQRHAASHHRFILKRSRLELCVIAWRVPAICVLPNFFIFISLKTPDEPENATEPNL